MYDDLKVKRQIIVSTSSIMKTIGYVTANTSGASKSLAAPLKKPCLEIISAIGGEYL